MGNRFPTTSRNARESVVLNEECLVSAFKPVEEKLVNFHSSLGGILHQAVSSEHFLISNEIVLIIEVITAQI